MHVTQINLVSQNELSIYIDQYITLFLEGCKDVVLPTAPESVSCKLHSLCLGIDCCLNMDFRITRITSHAWFYVDPCDFQFSLGLGSWFRNVSLFSYTWGTEKSSPIGKGIIARYVFLFFFQTFGDFDITRKLVFFS